MSATVWQTNIGEMNCKVGFFAEAHKRCTHQFNIPCAVIGSAVCVWLIASAKRKREHSSLKPQPQASSVNPFSNSIIRDEIFRAPKLCQHQATSAS